MKFIKLLKEAQFHGAQRIADLKDRWIWLTMLLLLFWLATSVVILLVERYLENPTFIGHFHRMYYRVAFPMVAVCPEINYPPHRMEAFLNKIKLPPDVDLDELRSVLDQLSALYAPDMKFNLNDLETIESVLEYNKLTVEEAGYMLSASCEEILLRCSWSGRITDCSKLFKLVMTRYGFCCVFNGRSLRLDSGKSANIKQWHTFDVGPFTGLAVVVNQSQEINDVDLTYKWVVVQDDHYFCDTTFNGTALPPGLEQWIMFSRTGFQVSEETRSLSDSLRKCRLSSEPLKYFPIYNRKHCILECEMAKMIEHCECIGVIYPPVPNVPICKSNMIYCIKSVTISLSDHFCDCPEACETKIGNYRIDSHKLISTATTFDAIYSDLKINKTSVLRVYSFGHGELVLDRRAMFGLYDLYSQLGGIFSAFYGCSILTLLELLQIFWLGFFVVKAKCRKQSQNQNMHLNRHNNYKLNQLAILNNETKYGLKTLKHVQKERKTVIQKNVSWLK